MQRSIIGHAAPQNEKANLLTLAKGRIVTVLERRLKCKDIARTRIMYIENKSAGRIGPSRIGRVTFNRTGRTLYYKEKAFQRFKGSGFKANYYDLETADQYWISAPRKDGADGL